MSWTRELHFCLRLQFSLDPVRGAHTAKYARAVFPPSGTSLTSVVLGLLERSMLYSSAGTQAALLILSQ